MKSSCPCGSGRPSSECCEPFIEGRSQPETAEALMRSRFTAFALGSVDYLVSTHDPAEREPELVEEVRQWANSAHFTELEVLDTEAGGPTDDLGFVEFIARYTEDGRAKTLRERSRFRRIDGSWFYVDGVLGKGTPDRVQPKVGRNEPCPCGSGKKYKKCCRR